MIEQPNNAADGSAESNVVDAAHRSKPMVLSFIGLLVGILALGLAAIPALAFDRPIPNPFAAEPKKPPPVEPRLEREGGITIKYKKLSINLGGKIPEKKEPAKEPAEPPLELTKDPIRRFTIAAIGTALIGLVVASIGQVRERHTVLTISSMSCCVAAIAFQYFVIGIAIGAGLAALLIVFAILAPALNA